VNNFFDLQVQSVALQCYRTSSLAGNFSLFTITFNLKIWTDYTPSSCSY